MSLETHPFYSLIQSIQFFFSLAFLCYIPYLFFRATIFQHMSEYYQIITEYYPPPLFQHVSLRDIVKEALTKFSISGSPDEWALFIDKTKRFVTEQVGNCLF
jgi:hypothetical protein